MLLSLLHDYLILFKLNLTVERLSSGKTVFMIDSKQTYNVVNCLVFARYLNYGMHEYSCTMKKVAYVMMKQKKKNDLGVLHPNHQS